MTANASPSSSAGGRFGRFRLGARLGQGGMGTVYQAHDPQLDRAVALKVMRDDRGDPSLLLREAQALAALSHPNVVHVYDVGSEGDQVFLAMELVDGLPLDCHLEQAAPDWRAVLGLFVQAGRGLQAVHDVGLIHRDFKPSNVLVDRHGRVRVSDFGLARRERGTTSGVARRTRDDAVATDETVDAGVTPALDATLPAADTSAGAAAPHAAPRGHAPATGRLLATPLTSPGAIVGTPRYMAPEQHEGAAITRQADQFAFAVALWESLYGAHPFDTSSGEHLRRAMVADQVQPPPPRSPVPVAIERVVRRGLRHAPDQRWPSMAALVDELERLARRRSRTPLLVAGVAIAASAAGATYLTTRDGGVAVDCGRAATAIEDVWSASARRQVVTAVSALGPAWVEVGEHTAGTLDAWATRWRLARVDGCRATHVRHEQPPAVLAGRAACLDGQLGDLAALAGGLAVLDRSGAQHLGAALSALPAPESCTAARVADLVPTDDPRLKEVERAVAEARVAITLLRPDHAAQAERALRLATELGAPGPRARALIQQAAALTDPAAARAALDRALADAAAARDPGIETDVVLATLTAAAKAGVSERIETLLPVARAAITRAGEPRPLLHALATAEAAAYLRLAQVAPARSACDRMVATAAAEDVEVLRTGCACRVALVARDNPAALTGCADHVAAAGARWGRHHPRTVDAVHNHLTALVRNDQLDQAAAQIEPYVRMVIELWGEDSLDTATSIQLHAVLLDRLGRPAESRAMLERAVAVLDRVGAAGGPQRAGLLLELSDRALQAGDLAAAVRHADDGLATFERSVGPDHPDLSTALIFHAEALGRVPAQRGRAEASWRRALTTAEQHGGGLRWAAVAEHYAAFLVGQDRPAEAVPLLEQSIAVFDRDGAPVDGPRVRHQLGELQQKLGHPREARAAYTAARDGYARLGSDHASELAEVEAALRALP